jgi:hypothetical protein
MLTELVFIGAILLIAYTDGLCDRKSTPDPLLTIIILLLLVVCIHEFFF